MRMVLNWESTKKTINKSQTPAFLFDHPLIVWSQSLRRRSAVLIRSEQAALGKGWLPCGYLGQVSRYLDARSYNRP